MNQIKRVKTKKCLILVKLTANTGWHIKSGTYILYVNICSITVLCIDPATGSTEDKKINIFFAILLTLNILCDIIHDA